MNPILRKIINFLVPTPQTVRRHRAPSARFATLAALAAKDGASLMRHGRNYNLVASDNRVFEFDNLAQVKSFLTWPTDRADGGPYPGDADYVERPRNIYKVGALSPAVAQGDTYDIGSPPTRLGDPNFMNQEGNLKPGPATDVGSSGKFVPFVPVVTVPIVK